FYIYSSSGMEHGNISINNWNFQFQIIVIIYIYSWKTPGGGVEVHKIFTAGNAGHFVHLETGHLHDYFHPIHIRISNSQACTVFGIFAKVILVYRNPQVRLCRKASHRISIFFGVNHSRIAQFWTVYIQLINLQSVITIHIRIVVISGGVELANAQSIWSYVALKPTAGAV